MIVSFRQHASSSVLWLHVQLIHGVLGTQLRRAARVQGLWIRMQA